MRRAERTHPVVLLIIGKGFVGVRDGLQCESSSCEIGRANINRQRAHTYLLRLLQLNVTAAAGQQHLLVIGPGVESFRGEEHLVDGKASSNNSV